MTHFWSTAVDIVCWILVVPILAYYGYRIFQRSDNRGGLIVRWVIFVPLIWIMVSLIRHPSPFAPVLLIGPALVVAILWAPNVASILAGSLTNAFDGGQADGEEKPFYFVAEGLRRKGQFPEAIAAVQKQLAKFPGDYEGYVKLAAIQMENLNSLPDALATLEEFLNLPDRAPNQIVAALHMMADWQLQFGHDAQAATATLQRIVTLFPGTPIAHSAEQRIAHLVQADETRRHREIKFTVKPGERDLGLRASAQAAASSDPHAQAAEIVKHLEQHPSDTEARERLAVLYAEGFQRVDLAADQLEQLIALPAETPKHIAHWLNLLATLQIQHAGNLNAATDALRRINQLFPGGALAAVAAARLATVQAELKAGQKTAVKALGNYEKNIGLKLSE